jgi:uncharacterized protein YndB with AHSA1/START domain
MTVIKTTVDIDRTPEDVFDYLVDLTNELEWNPRVESMEKITEGPVGVGTQYRAKWKGMGSMIMECTDYDRPRGRSFIIGGPVGTDLDISLTPTPEGTTTLMSRAHPRPKGLFALISPIVVLMTRRAIKTSLENGKQALEGK